MPHKVLLVDDEPRLLEGLQRALRKEPYQIVTASSAEDALGILRSDSVDVVISDQDMPGTTGTEFLARVHQEYPDTVRFILTGHATLEVAIQSINDGAISRFFTKPCNPIDLAVTIRQALQHKDLMAEADRLRQTTKRQSALIERLEQDHPGITKIEKDASGAIIMKLDPPGNDEPISGAR